MKENVHPIDQTDKTGYQKIKQNEQTKKKNLTMLHSFYQTTLFAPPRSTPTYTDGLISVNSSRRPPSRSEKYCMCSAVPLTVIVVNPYSFTFTYSK